MAMSATIAVNRAYITAGEPINIALTIKNTSGSAVNVSDVCTFIDPDYSGTIGKPHMGAGANLVVPASGTLTMYCSQTFFAGIQNLTKQFLYTVGATVYTDDASVFAASPTCNINVVPTRTNSSEISIALPGAFPNPPLDGQLRFESNFSSGQIHSLI